MSAWLAARAWGELVYLDLVGLGGFRAVHSTVSGIRRLESPEFQATATQVIEAVQTACALYVKPVKCLQRSAVLTRLLRRQGVPADMMIGCHLVPLKAHAWVEIAGAIVDGYEDGVEHYCVLDRW